MERDCSLLTPFQLEVAQMFFSPPAAQGFLLAGGAALIAQGMTHRPTQDLDFFTARGVGEVARAEGEFSGQPASLDRPSRRKNSPAAR